MHLYELKNAGIEAINRIFQLLYAIGEEYDRWFDEVSLCDYHLLISMAEAVDRLSFDYVMIKHELEAAEARAEKAENERDKLREAMKLNCLQCELMHKNGNCMEVGGFCTSVPAAYCPLIPKLLKKISETESRAEKAERERDIAVEQLHHCENNCDYCRNRCECDKEICFSPSPITGEPTDCWKWCGLEE